MGVTRTGRAVDAALKTLRGMYLLLNKIQESAQVLLSATFQSGNTNKILCVRSTPRDGLLVLWLIYGENRGDDGNLVSTDAGGTRLIAVRAMPFLPSAVVDGKDQN